MRRWFIALFALHFWVLVAAFALGQGSAPTQARATATAEPWVTVINGAAMAIDAETLDPTTPEHALADTQPELPEGLSPVVHPGLARVIPPAPTEIRQPPPVSPWVARLERPPRHSLTLA